MIDIITRKIVDMIPSRDYEEVKNWLESFPNLKVVSRDGSITYSSAIAAAHPNVLQVSDRFHLLKNLSSYCSDYLIKLLKTNVKIKSVTDNIIAEPIVESKAVENRKLTLKEKCERMDALLLEGHSKTKVCSLLNMDVRTFDRLQSMNDKERESKFQHKAMLKHEENVAKKQAKIDQAREMFRNGFSVAAISREMKIDRRTVTTYLEPNCSAVHSFYGEKRESVLSPYLEEVNSYIEKGYTSVKIDEIIRAKGYKGSMSTVSHYVSGWKSRFKKIYMADKKEANIEFVERKKLLELLYKPQEKVKDLSIDQLTQVNIEYPVFAKIINLVTQFKKLISDRNVGELENWIKEALSLGIRGIDSFVNGLQRDLTAVKNAIIYDYNNGLAEGSINKLKVIKRIMYGRCDFETLRKKVLRLEFLRSFN